MAISLKNIDDRVRILENYIIKSVYTPVVDSAHKVRVIDNNPVSFVNNYLKTGKYIALDYTTFDNCDNRTFHSCVIPIQIIQNKPYYTQDTYMSSSSQGLKLVLDSNKLTVHAYNYDVGGSSAIWIVYLSVFKYYLNTVLGWVM